MPKLNTSVSDSRNMAWQPGQRLQDGKYIIQKQLGEGGFGVTYTAQHTLFNSIVVIKTPNDKLRNNPEYPKYVGRFLKEARTLEQLSKQRHPHIVQVKDLFQERGIPCLVMEFIQGDTLFDLVQKQGALLETQAVNYICQIGEALKVVHQAQLVHRDAHPGNIMLMKDHQAILIDFGLAGEIFPTNLTSMHHGNQAFAPYEQMGGNRDPTVDIYTLSASLYYAVTGQVPTPAISRKLYPNKNYLTPPQQIDPGISDGLNRAIMQGMELEASDRPQSIDDFLKLIPHPHNAVLSPPRILRPKVRFQGNIQQVWIEHNVYMDLLQGMNIHLSFVVNNLKDVPCQATAYFYFSDGDLLKDFNNAYCTSDGQVVVSESFIPFYTSTVYSDFVLFMPYEELHLDIGEHSLKFRLELAKQSKFLPDGIFFAKSDDYYFELMW